MTLIETINRKERKLDAETEQLKTLTAQFKQWINTQESEWFLLVNIDSHLSDMQACKKRIEQLTIQLDILKGIE